MPEIVKETITTQSNDTTPVVVNNPANNKADSTQTMSYLIYFIFGLLEILLTFRLALKLTGASMASAFVSFIYGLTGIFILPFEGIFHKELAQGIETTSVFEPSTLIAIIVYALLAFGIVKLMLILSGKQQPAE